MQINEITNKEGLDTLYESSALTIEGLTPESIPDFEAWFIENGGVPTGIYTFSGGLMNRVYALTGDNAYPDDLSFAAITYGSITYRIVIGRFEFGGRWFDDIVDNNARREDSKC